VQFLKEHHGEFNQVFSGAQTDIVDKTLSSSRTIHD
jgi:hypothetical protein